MFWRILALPFLLLISLMANAQNGAFVTVVDLPYVGLQIQSSQAMRLSEVVTQAHQHVNFAPYIEASRLFNIDKQNQIDQIKRLALNELEELATQPKSAPLAHAMIDLIKHRSFSYREIVNLDIDAIRMNLKNDPLIAGHFSLTLMPRNNNVSVIGGVERSLTVNFDANSVSRDYLKPIKRLTGANKSFAWIIYPNGESIKVGNGYWNNQFSSLMPGTILFVGFNDAINAQFPSLENHLVTLLTSAQGRL
jgi:hypothetical protein